MKKRFLSFIRRLLAIDKLMTQLMKISKELNFQKDQLTEIYGAHLFQSTIIDSSWLVNKGFSPGRWAVDYTFLYTLYRVLNEVKPNKILEFGLGQTTRMISQYCEYYNAKAFTFEHDQNWIDFFKNSFDLSRNLKIYLSELQKKEYKGYEVYCYEDIITQRNGEKIELIILDGPFGSPRYSRIQILDLIPKYIDAENFCILIDDYQRPGEKDTVEEIFNLMKVNDIKYSNTTYSGQKEHLLICSINNIFLTSI